MKILTWVVIASLPLATMPAGLSQIRDGREPPMVVRGVGSCAELTSLKLPHVEITGAAMTPAKAGTSYCRVQGLAHPTSDSNIGFEVWIPDGWNGRYLQVGNGGFAGVIPEAAMIAAVAQGYAVAGTDDGHVAEGTDARWALGHPEKQIDFGYRALKETTDAAKAIIAAYTGRLASYSYFQGCSDGGREALMEAQRYPADFDGIVAGDPANHWTHLLTASAGAIQATNATPGSWLPPAKLALIQAEALRQCGDEDGVIQDPEGCRFRPAKIRCKSGDAPDCLSDAQLTALAALYRGTRNPRSGEKILSGFSPGGEGETTGWGRWVTGTAPGNKDALIYKFSSNFFRHIVFSDPNYDVRKLNFDSDVAMIDRKFAPIFNSYSPDLSAFQQRGGKLIQYHGWADPAIPALDSVDYYRSVQAKMGKTGHFYRLFMAPGMLHCGGGRGPNQLATLPAITDWVEKGKAPDHLVATKYQDNDPAKPVERVRPLCVYPARAAWDGKGDKSKLESFRCAQTKS